MAILLMLDLYLIQRIRHLIEAVQGEWGFAFLSSQIWDKTIPPNPPRLPHSWLISTLFPGSFYRN